MHSGQSCPGPVVVARAEAGRHAPLTELRLLLRRTEQPCIVPGLGLGLPDMEACLSGGGLAPGALHHLVPASSGDLAAAFGAALAFAACAGAQRTAPLILVMNRGVGSMVGRPYAHGLAQMGVPAQRLMQAETANDRTALAVLEEVLRARSRLAVVLGLIQGPLELGPSRRLTLAAAQSGAPLLLWQASTLVRPVASATRWRVAARGAARDRFGRATAPRWHLALERSRNGRTGAWTVEWHSGTHRFDLAAALADDALAAPARRSA